MHCYCSLDLTPNFSNRFSSKYRILFFSNRVLYFYNVTIKEWIKCDLSILLPWYQNLLTKLYFQSWTAYCSMSKVKFIVVPLKCILQWSQVLYQLCNSVPHFVSYSKLLWNMLFIKVLPFHLKIFYNTIKKHTQKSLIQQWLTIALYRQVSLYAISFCTILL